MIPLILAAAAAALPQPLTADEQQQLKCVAVLAIVDDAQKRGTGFTDRAPVAAEGRAYAGIVGDAVAAVAGRDLALVRNWMIDGVIAQRRQGVTYQALEVCRTQARLTLAQDQARSVREGGQ